MLTPEQQKQVEEMLPMAESIARRFSRDDDVIGMATLALCEAVRRYRFGGSLTLSSYCGMHVRNEVRRYLKRERRMRRIGTAGGAPSRAHIEDASAKGRRTRRSAEDFISCAAHNLDESLSTTDNVLPSLVSRLPTRLQAVAHHRWILQDTLEDTAIALELPVHTIHRMAREAETMARLFVINGL